VQGQIGLGFGGGPLAQLSVHVPQTFEPLAEFCGLPSSSMSIIAPIGFPQVLLFNIVLFVEPGNMPMLVELEVK